MLESLKDACQRRQTRSCLAKTDTLTRREQDTERRKHGECANEEHKIDGATEEQRPLGMSYRSLLIIGGEGGGEGRDRRGKGEPQRP